MGLQRQVIDEGDPDAFPPVDPTYESDDQLRTRYYLAPHGFSNAGPRLSYKYHAMTLDEKPLITVESPESNVLTVTYKFEQGSFAGQVKDADGIRTAPGRVKVPILAHDGDGTPSAELIAATQEYLERDDVAVETDIITVVPAEILPYTINAIAYIDRGPDVELTKESGESALAEYANNQRRLKGVIDPGMIGHLLYGIGAKKVDVLSPSNEISASRSQAPYCQSITVEVRVRDE
jgi:phage-related baseplate assembly protein